MKGARRVGSFAATMRAALVLVASAALWVGSPDLAAGSDPRKGPPPRTPRRRRAPPTASAHLRPPAPPRVAGQRAAEESAHQAGHVAAAEARHRGRRWFALPVLFWLPETHLGFGATGGLHVDLDGAPRPSSFFAAAVYTLERQGSGRRGRGRLPPRRRARVRARTRRALPGQLLRDRPPHLGSAAREVHPPRGRGGGDGGAPGRLAPPRRAAPGPAASRRSAIGSRAAPSPRAPSPAGTATRRWRSAGASSWDSRDSAFWPSTGKLAQAWYVYAPESIGRNHGFGRGVLEVRQFLPLGRGRVLGLDGFVEGAHGDPPFTLLPNIGSNHFLRGIREGRFRDRLDWAAQAELRVPVHGPLSATAFAAAGAVAARLGTSRSRRRGCRRRRPPLPAHGRGRQRPPRRGGEPDGRLRCSCWCWRRSKPPRAIRRLQASAEPVRRELRPRVRGLRPHLIADRERPFRDRRSRPGARGLSRVLRPRRPPCVTPPSASRASRPAALPRQSDRSTGRHRRGGRSSGAPAWARRAARARCSRPRRARARAARARRRATASPPTGSTRPTGARPACRRGRTRRSPQPSAPCVRAT